MKKRIAIWMHGGVGSGIYSQGQPCIQKLVKRLAAHYTIDVYMQLPPNNDFLPEGFSLFSQKPVARWGMLRWLYLFVVFYRNHQKEKYHLFYSFWGYPAGLIVVLLGKLFRRPSVIHLQGGDAAYLPSLGYGVFCHPLRRRLCVWAYSQCSCLIALTNYQIHFLRQFGVARPIHIIPYGVDTELFRYHPHRSHQSVIRCLHVGNQTPVKDQETLLYAFALLISKIPACLNFVGADFNNGRLNVLCISLGIESNVKFLGAQPYHDLPKYYHESDILIHTSLYEGQGLVFTEAAACGTLIAGTGVGILADMGEECGIITPKGDAEKLANKIIEVIQSPVRVIAMKTAARKWAVEKNENYSVNRIVEELNKHLHKS